MDRRAFLTGASAAAISATLPRDPGYFRRVVVEWGASGLGPLTVTREHFQKYQRMAKIFADVPGLQIGGPYFGVNDVVHLPGPGLLNEPVSLIPTGMTDWRQATPAEIADDIRRALNGHEPLGIEEPR